MPSFCEGTGAWYNELYKMQFAEQLQSGASMAPPPTTHKQTKPSAVKCDVLSGKKPHEIVDACTTPSWELRRHSLCSCEMGRGSLAQRELSANRLTEGLFYSRVDSPISIRQNWNLFNNIQCRSRPILSLFFQPHLHSDYRHSKHPHFLFL